MLDRDSFFEGNLGQKDNLIPLLGDAHDITPPFFQEESGSFSTPKLDFTDLEQYQEAGEFNWGDRLDLFAGNQTFSGNDKPNFKEFIDDNFKDIIGDVERSIDYDSLLNSDRPFSKFSKDSLLEDLPFEKGDFKPGEGMTGEGKVPPLPVLLKNSDLSLDDLPFEKGDFKPGEGMRSEGKMPPLPALLKNSDLSLDDLPFEQGDFKGTVAKS